MEKTQHENINQKKAGVAIIICDKVDLRATRFIRDRKRHYILIKRSIHQEDTTVLDVYAPNS